MLSKIFCTHCGKLCTISKELSGTYDADSGQPYFYLKIKCPKAGRFNLLHTDHYYEVFDGVNPNILRMSEGSIDKAISEYNA